jgi:predicted aspartyl protease
MIPLTVRNLRMPHQENEIMAAKDFEELRKLVATVTTSDQFRTKNGGPKRCENHPTATNHTTEECRNKTQKKGAAPQQTQNTEPKVCTNHPKSNNHTTAECGLNKKKSNLVSTRTTNVKPTTIELKVNGTNFKALVDTGCTQTTISQTCYERIGSPKPAGHVILMLADKSSKKCPTVMVTIEALGRTMKVTAAIMDTAPEHDVLLGLDELTQIYELKEKALGNDMDPRVLKAMNANKNLTLEKPSKLTPFTLKLKADVKPIHEQQIMYKPELHEMILKELNTMVRDRQHH